MATKIFIIIASIVCFFFFLSVVSPAKSEKKFWKIIYKIRAGMDFASYWFFNLCGIATILFILYFIVKGMLK